MREWMHEQGSEKPEESQDCNGGSSNTFCCLHRFGVLPKPQPRFDCSYPYLDCDFPDLFHAGMSKSGRGRVDGAVI